MAIRPRKGPTQDREREAVIGRLFDGVLRSARNHLVRNESPLGAEVWASGLLSVWQAEGSSSDDGFAEAFVRYARADGTPEAAATLWALAGVVPNRLATKARTAAASLERAGVDTPPWAAHVGQSEPTQAWIGRDIYGDQEIIIVGFVYPSLPDEPEHSVCVLVDHNLGGVVKDTYLAAGLDATLERWRDAEANGITLRHMTLGEASARLEDALVATEIVVGDEAATRLVELRALLASRLESLPAAERTGGTGELDLDARDRMVADFLSSVEAEGLLSEPAVVTVCQSLVAYRADYGDGDPLRWSPTLASMCLLHHFPNRSGLDESDLALVPDLLCAWVRFAGRQRGLTEPAIDRVAAAVDSCREEFAAAVSGSVELPHLRLSAL